MAAPVTINVEEPVEEPTWPHADAEGDMSYLWTGGRD